MPPPDHPSGRHRSSTELRTSSLLRSAQLLEEALGCARAGANEALLMVVRTLLEIGFATAYLIAQGPEGMRRLHAEQLRQQLKLARPMLGDDHPDVTELQRRVEALGPGISFAAIASSTQVGGQRVYDQWYRLLSQVSVHGGLESARRYVAVVHGSQVRGRQRPDPPVSTKQALKVAGQSVVFVLNVVLPVFSLSAPPKLDAVTAVLGPTADSSIEQSSGDADRR
jgi:hypothetical protein